MNQKWARAKVKATGKGACAACVTRASCTHCLFGAVFVCTRANVAPPRAGAQRESSLLLVFLGVRASCLLTNTKYTCTIVVDACCLARVLIPVSSSILIVVLCGICFWVVSVCMCVLSFCGMAVGCANGRRRLGSSRDGVVVMAGVWGVGAGAEPTEFAVGHVHSIHRIFTAAMTARLRRTVLSATRVVVTARHLAEARELVAEAEGAGACSGAGARFRRVRVCCGLDRRRKCIFCICIWSICPLASRDRAQARWTRGPSLTTRTSTAQCGRASLLVRLLPWPRPL